jgi:hypothetical protein
MIPDMEGKKSEKPNGAAIAREFESIVKRTGFRGGEIFLVMRFRGENDSLTVSGHPAQGWYGLIHEDQGARFSANPSKPLPQENIMQIFQPYVRGDDLWKKSFYGKTLSSQVDFAF